MSRLTVQFPLEHFQLDVPLFSQTPHAYIMHHSFNTGLALHLVRVSLVLGPDIEGFLYPLSDCTPLPQSKKSAKPSLYSYIINVLFFPRASKITDRLIA